MGFLVGHSRLLQPPLSPCSHRKPRTRTQPVMACESLDGGNASSQRRSLLLVGISVLPLLQLREVAADEILKGARRMTRGRRGASQAVGGQLQEREKNAENQEADKEDLGNLEAQAPNQPEQEISSQEPSQPDVGKQGIGNPEAQGPITAEQEILFQETNQPEIIPIQNAPGNPFISFLNEIGVICSGVLGALYATSQKEKTAMESTIDSMKSELTEKEAATALLKENYEVRLLNKQEEARKQIRKFEEEEASLLTQLTSANKMISTLHQELNSEKYLTEELKARASQLEHAIAQAGENKKTLETKLNENKDRITLLQDKISLLSFEINDKDKSIESLNSSLAEKESEYKNLISVYEQAKSDLTEANSAIEKLKVEMIESREKLDAEKSSTIDLNGKIKSLISEKVEIDKKLHDLAEEYSELKLSSERERALDSELLSKKDGELQLLEERIGLAFSQASANQTMIAQLTKERDHAKAILEREVNAMEKLKNEQKTTQEALEASRLEASNLSKELHETKRSYAELTSRVSKIQDDFYESKKLLSSELDKEKSASKVLSLEIESIKEVLERTREELAVTSDGFQAAMEDRESLRKELLEIYKKVETTANELKEERKSVANLNTEHEAARQQILADSEARRSLEVDLDEATTSLAEMNKSSLLLSEELKETHRRSSSLESEKEMLIKSLIEHKNLAREAQENIEDAHNLITRLGGERESLEKRSKKLEEELTAAKGEILRLRRQIRPANGAVPSGVKKTVTRRRKGGSSTEDSLK